MHKDEGDRIEAEQKYLTRLQPDDKLGHEIKNFTIY